MLDKKRMLLLPAAALYAAFISLDLAGQGRYSFLSGALKYASVLLCFANALMFGKENLEKKDAALLKAAMFVTVCADYFLLFTDLYPAGILLFCTVQLIYIARHSRYSKPIAKKAYLAAFFPFIAAAYLASAGSGISAKALVLAGFLYALLTVCSLHTAFLAYKAKRYPLKNAVLINAGLWLLMLCDINIFLSFAVPSNFLSQYLEWLFYLPSQLLLSFSARK
jgi:hypothetical protein